MTQELHRGAGLQDLNGPEQIVARVRTHGRRLVFPVLLLFVLAGSSGYFIGSFSELWINIVLAVVAGIVLIVGVLGPIVRWLTHSTTLTTHRVIRRWGVFERHRSQVAYTHIRTVSTHRSLWQRMFGSGDIELSIVEGGTLTLRDLPALESHAEVLQQLVERSYRAQNRAMVRGQGFFDQ